jgi:hypothetical protein
MTSIDRAPASRAPAVCSLDHGACAGLALRAVACRDVDGGDDATVVSELVERWENLVASLASPGEPRAFDLRLQIMPDTESPLRGSVRCVFLCRAPTPELVIELTRDLASLMLAFSAEYDVEPITKLDELRGALLPYDAPHLVEIARREAYENLDRARRVHASPMGPCFPATGGPLAPSPAPSARPLHSPTADDARVYVPYPMTCRRTTLARLFAMLLDRGEPLVISVLVEPTTLAPDEHDWLVRSVESCERGVQLPLGARLRPALHRRASALLSIFSEQFCLLQDRAQLVQIRVASPRPLRDSFASAIASELVAPVSGASGDGPHAAPRGGFVWGRPPAHALGAAQRAMTNLTLEPWLPSVAGQTLRRARYLFDTTRTASLFRLPTPTADELPGIAARRTRIVAPPRELPASGTLLGEASHLGRAEPVRMQTDDRRRHCYVVGQTGTGKTTLFHRLVMNDIRAGHGVCVIDPHGDLVDRVLSSMPRDRADDVIVFDPSDRERPIGFNVLEWRTRDEKYFLVQELVAMLFRMFPPDMIGPMFEHNVRNALLTLMANKDDVGTLAELPRLFSDKTFFKRFLPHIDDPLVRDFWLKEREGTSDFHRSEMLGYLVSKFDRFIGEPTTRNIIAQQRSGICLREVMENRKILLIELGKGTIGELPSMLLGMVFVAKLFSATLQRAAIPEEERRDFYLYVDEFQNIVTPTFAAILSEARKYRLNLTVTNQYLRQLTTRRDGDDLLHAVLGNVGTLVAFRLGVRDAEVIAKQFEPTFNATDLANLPNWRACVSMLVDGQRLRPFGLRSVRDDAPAQPTVARALRQLSRLRYGRERSVVEDEVQGRWRDSAVIAVPPPPIPRSNGA